MKMQLLEFENDIVFNDDTVNVVEIENVKIFRNIVRDLIKLSNGEEQDSIKFVDSGEEQNYSNKLLCISDYYNFDYNTSKNINTLYKCLFSDEYLEMTPIYSQLIKKYNEILSSIDIDLCYDELNFISLSKAMKLRIDLKNDSIFKNILSIIDVESELHLNRLLIFVNVKDYLEKEELEELYKYILYKKVRVLLIESKHSDLGLLYEKKLEIDSDFVEFII